MFWLILLVLIVFMALLIAGLIYTVRGGLYKNKRQLWTGIILIVLCCIFTYAMKFVPGLY